MRAADEIEARFGPIDVLEHSPTPSPPGREHGPAPGRMFSGPLDVDVAGIVPLLDLYLLTPIALVRRVLPGMRERGHGGLLFAMGAAARYPIPQLAAGGIALSAVRSYIHTLNPALADTGVVTRGRSGGCTAARRWRAAAPSRPAWPAPGAPAAMSRSRVPPGYRTDPASRRPAR
jgi:NAD(P)-dependent dehydrogenase (short-subunit alcohol dehydrogenase family)